MRSVPKKVPKLLAFVPVLLGIGYLFYIQLKPAADTRWLVQQVGTALQVGDGADEVRDAFEKSQLTSRSFRVDGFEALVVETPMEFGATNWCLLILTERQERKVVGVGYRTADSLQHRPPGASTDRVVEAAMPVWEKHFVAD